ncbi:2610_t:CDS:2, partial [Racocetra fulgida]
MTNPQPNFPPNSVSQNLPNLPPVQAPNRQQETLQALLALATSLNPTKSQMGKRDPQRSSGNLHPTKRRKEKLEEKRLEEETLEQLMEEEADKEEKVNNYPEVIADSSIALLKPTNITYSQLFRIASALQGELAKIKKGKNKPVNVKCHYDEAGNAYLEEENIQPDLYRCITNALAIESPICDLFNYYYEDRQDPYQIGRLESKQHFQLQQFLRSWTNLVKHHIDTSDALPIKQYPYHHSPAKKKIIQEEISYIILYGSIHP